ncbi:hypothetical protein PUNSTDRAFT_117642 [Punctularia strigosozonata HHB-11173 SS5]|uniref:uncharacterized protein n=1 Tax=Punctularia strigosozonata (strain HHB-11173) TaxID=741275 RepID=UPI000441760E|nr:uncharacterized protein PUNSTDRAFT_117642 [Punctularia strigosozonata HHB-11173 SS5]EIN14037.1 hypothetical protein PUNSTDRAFT_117642 [Punctularia strigosozonata HHB-11173 SS5]
MDDEENELRNPFPSPPSHYTNYTSHNLKLLTLLRERVGEADLNQINQQEVLGDQDGVPEWPLAQLEPPRVDWILQEGVYEVFGDTWKVNEKIPSLGELGGNQLYPEDPAADRRPALLSILESTLVTYSALVKSLVAPPPPPGSDVPPEWQRHIEWITVLAQNMIAATNDLRPVQARANLELMMRRQLELRKEETAAIHAKCQELEAKLAAFCNMSPDLSATSATDVRHTEVVNGIMARNEPWSQNADEAGITTSDHKLASLPTEDVVSLDDVLRWAEEIG